MLIWLQTKDYWEVGELEYKLAFEYDVVYESKQSYYVRIQVKEKGMSEGWALR